jgi:potassium-transporting ATPase potassium-binding subunit
MTLIGWTQILLYCVIIVAITPVLGSYMTRVFNGERTFLTPILRPVELGLYRAAGVDEKGEQGWLAYTVGMLLFRVGGFFILYEVMRFQALLPFNPAEHRLLHRICRSTLRSVSSPIRTGRTTAAKAQCLISCRCWA